MILALDEYGPPIERSHRREQYAPTWTDDRVELLKRLLAEKLSATQIAKEIGGITRNAVIGKVNRIRFCGDRRHDRLSYCARHARMAYTRR